MSLRWQKFTQKNREKIWLGGREFRLKTPMLSTRDPYVRVHKNLGVTWKVTVPGSLERRKRGVARGNGCRKRLTKRGE